MSSGGGGAGRARGRGRGRGWKQQQQQGGAGEQRPGSGPPPAQAPAAPGPAYSQQQQQQQRQPPPTQQQQQQQGGGNGNGRGRSRGGAAQVAPPGGMQAATSQMGAMSLGGAAAGGDRGAGRGRRSRDQMVEELQTRPAGMESITGKSGRQVSLVSNYFVLKTQPDWCMYQYHVSFSPPIVNKRMAFAMLNQHKAILGATNVFDGAILFLPHPLGQKKVELISASREGTDYKVTITHTADLPPSSPTVYHLYNVIFKRLQKALNLEQIGRHYFDTNSPINIPQHKLVLWPGFQTAIGRHEAGAMLCADVAHKVIRTSNVLDILGEVQHTLRGGNYHDLATKRLVGETVMTMYNNCTYRVDDIDWAKNPTHTFKDREGKDVSFQEFYAKHHERQINDLGQPLLLTRAKKRDKDGNIQNIHLIPELCTITGLTDDIRSDFRVMKDLAEHTRVSPDKRRISLQKFINQLNTEPNSRQQLQGWNMEFDRELVKIAGRQLPPENVFMADPNQSFNGGPQADWSRQFRDRRLIQPVPLKSWIFIASQRDMGKGQDFLQALIRVGRPFGMDVAAPTICELPNDRVESYLKALRENLDPKQTQMVMFILPNNNKGRYDAIKKMCCVDAPVPSQCILGRTISKPPMLMSVATKVAMQLNCKMGGGLWTLKIPLGGLMVVGIDVYHDSVRRGHSIGAVVASTNKQMTQYYSRVATHGPGQELYDQLQVNITACLRRYKELNQALPDRVIIYRDGVGDGQLPVVIDHEVKQIKDSFKAIGSDYNPRMGFVVVQKRINTRIFQPAGASLSNPGPGTIVDSVITKPSAYDFFLVSQHVRQGTVSPTRYNVIYDETGLQPDHIQQLTYKLTHMYYNWPGTIQSPAHCHYAHKLAFLVGQSIHADPSLHLADRLYYL